MREAKTDRQTANKEKKVGSIMRDALEQEESVLAKAANGQGELNPDK